MDKLIWSFLGLSVLVIENVQSRWDDPISDCINPSTSIRHAGEICSGKGACHRPRRGPDRCECSLADRDGFYEFSDDKLFFGKWCQCNPWNCIPTDLVNGSYG